MQERTSTIGLRAVVWAVAALLALVSADAAAEDPAPLDAKALVKNVGYGASLSVSGDGNLLAVAGVGRPVRIYDAATGVKFRELSLGNDATEAVFVGGSPPGLLTSSYRNSASVWNAATGKKRFVVRPPAKKSDAEPGAAFCSFAISPLAQSNCVLWIADELLCVQDAVTGRVLSEMSLASDPRVDPAAGIGVSIFSEAAASADGGTVVLLGSRMGGGTAMRVLRRGRDASALTVQGTFPLAESEAAFRSPRADVSGDGAIVVLSERDISIRAQGSPAVDAVGGFRTATGERAWVRSILKWRLRGRTPVCGNLIAIPTRRGVELADVRTGKAERVLALPLGEMAYDLAFDPRGGRLFALGYDAALYVWDLASPAAPPKPETTMDPLLWIDAAPASFASTADASLLAVGCDDGAIRLVDPSAKKVLRTLEGLAGPVTSVEFLGGGAGWLAGISPERAVVWNAATGEIRQEFAALPGKLGQGRPTAFAASRATPLLVLERLQQKPLLWSADAAPREWSDCPYVQLGALSISPDGARLAAFAFVQPEGTTSRGYGVFELATGKLVWSRHRAGGPLERAGGPLAPADEKEMADRWRVTRFTADGDRLVRVGNSGDPDLAASRIGRVRCCSAATGVPLWAVDLPGIVLVDLVVQKEGTGLLLTTSGPYDLDTDHGEAKPAADLPASTIGAAYAGKSGALYILLRDGAVVRATR